MTAIVCIAALQREKYEINPASLALKTRMSVYTQDNCALSSGDRIRLRLTNKARGHVANKEYIVERIDEGRAYLHNKDNSNSLELALNDKQDGHWDYAYSQTAFGAQSATETFVLALELAKRACATTHRSHEIDITRSRYQVSIYTEDESKLVSRLAKLKGDKTSAYQIKTGTNPAYNATTPTKESTTKKQDVLSPILKIEKKSLKSQEINELLTQQIELLAQHLLGTPNRISTANNFRFGSRGSVSINTNNGLWTNFETGEKGNALQLIATQMGFNNFKDTLAYAKDFLHHQDSWVVASQSPEKLKKTVEKYASNKQEFAKKLIQNSVPIQGTLAERYLKEYRKLSGYEGSDLRFIPQITTWHGDKKTHVPALLCIGNNGKGELNHVQVIRLDPHTGDKDYASKVGKQTYGSVNGCPIDLNKNSTSPITYLTEGVETGLSILTGDKHAKVMALVGKSNFKNIDLSRLANKVVLCLDNDGEATFKDSVISKAVERLTKAGKSVSIIMPEHMGDDFNDVLKKEGVSSIKKYMDGAVDASVFLLKELNKLMIPENKNGLANTNNALKLHDNSTLIKKIVTIENNQISDLKSIEVSSTNHLKRIADMQEYNDCILAKKTDIQLNYTKIYDQKILEKEIR